MVTAENKLPPVPEIGRPDMYYMHIIAQAEQDGDVHRRAAAKVARYITLALNPELPWAEKLRYFVHALKHHCVPQTIDADVQPYYEQLSNLIREHCGAEALRLASQEDDAYATRLALGQDRPQIEEDAEAFFGQLMHTGDQCPNYFNPPDWEQLKLIRNQWI